MVEILAELLDGGLVDPAGKLVPGRGSHRIQPARGNDRVLSYIVVPEDQTRTGQQIIIDERDIQALLRTKAAVYSAYSLMLKSVGLGLDAIAEVYVAGGFGRFLDLERSITIGLLPDLPLGRFTYLGNSALMGAQAMLCSRSARRKATQLADRLTYMELNADPEYMNEYTGALFLPHTDQARFPSARLKRRARGSN